MKPKIELVEAVFYLDDFDELIYGAVPIESGNGLGSQLEASEWFYVYNRRVFRREGNNDYKLVKKAGKVAKRALHRDKIILAHANVNLQLTYVDSAISTRKIAIKLQGLEGDLIGTVKYGWGSHPIDRLFGYFEGNPFIALNNPSGEAFETLVCLENKALGSKYRTGRILINTKEIEGFHPLN